MYESKQDLIDILVPYFAEGLRNNEFCMWVTSQPLEVEEAREALTKVVPDLDSYFEKGQIEIISYNKWYLKDGTFDSIRVSQGWVDKEKAALERGFAGLRLSGNTFWIKRDQWNSFVDYEEVINSVIKDHRIIALCTYALKNCDGTDVLDVVRNHVGTLIKQGDKWSLMEDAVQRKKALEEVIRLASFPALNPDPIVEVDFKGKVHFVNPATKTVFPDLLKLGSTHPFFSNFEKVIKAFKKGEISTFAKEEKIGEHCYYQQFCKVPKQQRIRIYSVNIDEMKQTEEKLRESEQLLNRSQEIAHLGSWELDLKSNKLSWSDEVYRIFGLKPQEFGATYEVFLDAVHPEDRAAVDAAYSGSLREGRDTYEIQHRIIRKSNGEVRFVHEKCEHIRDKSGRIVRSVGMVQDITESKKAENELRETRIYLENLLNYANAPIIVWNPDFKITFFNHAFERLTGLRADEVLEQNLEILFPENEKAEAMAHIKRTLEGEYWETVEIPILNTDGTVKMVLWNSANIYDSNGEQIVSTIAQGQDITDRKIIQEKLEDTAAQLEEYASRMEELADERARKLKDAECLAAIGQTAGMMGHDIRNPLQAIIGDLYLAHMDLSSMDDSSQKESVKESLQAIQGNVEYINKIVADLQDFARPLNPMLEKTDLSLLVDDLLLNNKIPKNIQVMSNVSEEARIFRGDSAFIKRVLGNLISNAVQAMPDGGKLSVCAYLSKGDTVITVEDSGIGIPEEVKPKLFQPLFTTKSKGQGFGLAVVKRMTEALNGTVTFESQAGKGTKFILRFFSSTNKKLKANKPS